MTYDELQQLCLHRHDPIADDASEMHIWPDEGLYIQGVNNDGRYADDLLITIVVHKGRQLLQLRHREPTAGDTPCHPPEKPPSLKWHPLGDTMLLFECFDDMHTWVYEL